MDDLVAAAEVRVLVRERVEAVRAARDDLRRARLVQRGDVLLGERLEDVLVAHPPRGVAGARLARAEDRDVEPGGEQQLHRRLGGPACPLVERGGAADPVEDLGRRVSRLEYADAEPFRPGRAFALRLAPRVRAPLDVAEHRLGLGREARLDHDEVPAQVDDVVDVLDRDRALVDAGAARHAVPHDVVRDGVRDERRGVEAGVAEHLRALGEDVVAEIHDQELRRQLLPGRVRGADVLAAAALGAGHRVEDPLPGEVASGARAEAELVVRAVEAQRLEAARATAFAEEHVRTGSRDVQMLGVGEIDEEREDQQHVRPDEDALEHLGRRVVPEQVRERVRDGRPLAGQAFSAERDLSRVPEEEGRDDSGDEREDQVGLAEVAALEALRPPDLADPERRRDADEHEHAEEVDEQREPALALEPAERRTAGRLGSGSTT